MSLSKIQTLYDDVEMCSSVPSDEATIVIIDIIKNYISDFHSRKKPFLTDIHKPIELCLSTSHFLFNNQISILENLDPVGLAIVVVILEEFQWREFEAKRKALPLNAEALTCKR